MSSLNISEKCGGISEHMKSKPGFIIPDFSPHFGKSK